MPLVLASMRVSTSDRREDIPFGIYLARIPERLAPGVFDIWFQSHQLFHVFVVAAACVHYYGICVLSHNQTNFLGDCRDILDPNPAAMNLMLG